MGERSEHEKERIGPHAGDESEQRERTLDEDRADPLPDNDLPARDVLGMGRGIPFQGGASPQMPMLDEADEPTEGERVLEKESEARNLRQRP